MIVPICAKVSILSHFPGVDTSEVAKVYIKPLFVSIVSHSISWAMHYPSETIIHYSMLEVYRME